jgi:hypothetical protein
MLRVTNEEETLDKLYEKITPENSHAALFTSPI